MTPRNSKTPGLNFQRPLTPLRVGLLAFAVVPLLLMLSGCARHAAPAAGAPVKPRVETTSQGSVSVTFAFDPPVVRLDRDILLDITVTSPTNIMAKLPPFENRVKGFTVAGTFESEHEIVGGKLVRHRHVRLTPQIAAEYRIAAMAVTWNDPTSAIEQWFPIKPMVLASEPLVQGEAGRAIAAARGPVRIYPGIMGFVGYALAILVIAAVCYGVWCLIRKIRRTIQLRRMSPKERALLALAELIAKDLIARDLVKEFYFELTMIVRSYIERAHAVRAPEQTTEEFLAAVSQDPRFSPSVVKCLRDFMQAADLVKYAAFRPEASAVQAATSTARTYIEADSEVQEAQ